MGILATRERQIRASGSGAYGKERFGACMRDYLAEVRSGLSLRDVPRKAKSFRTCFAAVQRDGLELYHVPKYHRVEPILYSAFHKSADSIRFCDLETFERAPDALLMAVRSRPSLLIWLSRNVPDAISPELCEAAVKADGFAITQVPKIFITPELVKLAAVSNGKVLSTLIGHYDLVRDVAPQISLAHLPEELMTREICFEQVSKQGRLLKYVPLSLMDNQLVLAALDSNPWAIEFVPITFSELPEVKAVVESNDMPKSLTKLFVEIA
ncbi:DUF4116 domain-containing protein [uncultured Microbulbifer sp.]|uniref:DUF4116 domain-containing protein n=1 Tax=uncultured Microbulbifer sp. TaxID=348147 RepID=UPI00261817A5|nr:DUF4116 domain-containing protein [uncultured Microbulbifer sp.]